jgi:hypothetical protein
VVTETLVVLLQELTRLTGDSSAITLMRIDGAALLKFTGEFPWHPERLAEASVRFPQPQMPQSQQLVSIARRIDSAGRRPQW